MRRVALLLGLGGALAALALTASPSQRATHVALVTHDELPVLISSGRNIGADYAFSWSSADGAHTRLADLLAVFAKPGAPQDLLPPSLQQLVRFMTRPGTELDRPRARLLVASGAHRIYGVPMKNGSVCIFRETFGGASCVPALFDGAYPQVDPGWRSQRGQVWGLTDNDARSVRVHVRSSWLTAKLGRNGFYLELPTGVVAPKQIVVGERTGIRHFYDIKRCRIDRVPPVAGPLSPPLC